MTDGPETAGHYWAKWRIANDGTRDAAELVPSDHWEVVQVFENRLDREENEFLMVSIPGVERSQFIEKISSGGLGRCRPGHCKLISHPGLVVGRLKAGAPSRS